MALFGSYAPPGVYTSVVISGAGQPLFSNARIPVIIGEGQEFFTQSNVELHRGSSSVADEQVVNENISDQVTEITNQLHTSYFPVVTGNGSGTVTDDPSYVQVTDNGLPVTVVALNGASGSFTTQELITPGDNVEIAYYFKRTDTLITNEDDSDQVPSFGTLLITDSHGSQITVSVTIPGAIDNNVSIFFADDSLSSPPGVGVVDALAVSGAGTDSITIDLRKSVSPPVLRTIIDVFNLIQAGIPTADSGYLTATVPTADTNSPPTIGSLSSYIGTTNHLNSGTGPNSNTTFKVQHVPIVDGSNGGVVTTDITKVTAKVNGSVVAISAVNGQTGFVTLSSSVPASSTLTFTYYTNTYQNTFDLLPAANVASITAVGLGPDRTDFIEDTDYVLGQDANGNGTINWGSSDTVTSGVSTTGYTPFGPTQITTTLVDDMVYLRPTTGVVNGKNATFTLQDTPVDGSGRAVPTDNPNLVSVYVGLDPIAALINGAVQVITLSGATGEFTLRNAPQVGGGNKVFASYWRNTLNDHSYTVKVVNPGIPGQGTYIITDENGNVLPLATFNYSASNVTQSGSFAQTGIVWPSDFSDLYAAPGAVDEVVTVTFANDPDAETLSNATQAQLTTQGIIFTAQTPGGPGSSPPIPVNGNSVSVAFDTTTQGTPTVNVVGGNATIIIHGSLTVTEVVEQFPIYVVSSNYTGYVFAAGSGSTLVSTASALALTGGTNGTGQAAANAFTVNGVTSTGGQGSSGTGYVGQTYIDAVTGLRFTIVPPVEALSYGYTTLPDPQYQFQADDTLVFDVSKETARYAGSVYFPFGTAQPNSLVAIAGLWTKVVTTFGANTGDTAIIDTFNKSGNEPAIGEFYYVSFTVSKTASDMAITLYTRASDAYAAYGQPSTVNRVSLGVQLLTQNGAQQFGVIQVPQQEGLSVASDQEYINAIQTLTVALPGTQQKANIVVPLSVSTTVHQFLSRQLITQANVRNKGEAIGFVGYSTTTTPTQATANAVSLSNARMMAIGMPAAGILLTNSLTGVQIEYAVDGSFMAAALAGLNANPANDVATTLTLQDLVGFSRLLVQYDDATMDQMASNGLICLLNNNGALQVRHYKSTDPSNIITSEPTCTTVTDYVRQQFRSDLKQFIGRKLVTGLLTDIGLVCNSRLLSLVNNEIITAYTNPAIVQDPTDPTTVDVTVTFKPMFSLLYISVTFTVTTSL